MEFKVGEKYKVGISGEKGNIIQITSADGGIVRYKTLKSGPNYANYESQFTPESAFGSELTKIDADRKILITSDGATTLARLYEGNTVVKTAQAKCSPEDTFDFDTGAKLAMDRLMGEKPAQGKTTEPVFIKGGYAKVIGRMGFHDLNVGEIVKLQRKYPNTWMVSVPEKGRRMMLPNDMIPCEAPKAEAKPEPQDKPIETKPAEYKFKVGDKVIGNEKANQYRVTIKGWVGTVKDISENGNVIDVFGKGLSFSTAVWAYCFDLYTEPSKPAFDWDAFKSGRIAVHCDTEEKAKAFLKEAKAHGLKWCSGDDADDHTNWSCYKKDTCYSDGIGYCNSMYHKARGYTIIDYPFAPTPTKPADPPKAEPKKPKYFTGKVVCVANGMCHTKGKVYEIKDGIINDDSCEDGEHDYNYGAPVASIDELNTECEPKFIEFKG